MELSSEVPGPINTGPRISLLWVNETEVGDWTSPGDFGQKEVVLLLYGGKLEGSQHGLLKTPIITEEGRSLDGENFRSVSV